MGEHPWTLNPVATVGQVGPSERVAQCMGLQRPGMPARAMHDMARFGAGVELTIED